jgi:homoserine kinase
MGGFVAVAPGPQAVRIAPPEGLAFVLAVPAERVSTRAARRALPARVPLGDAAATLARAVGLVLALREGRLEDLPPLLIDLLHEPARADLVPGLAVLRALAHSEGCLGVTISGSGPAVLLWCRKDDADALAAEAERAAADAGAPARARPSRVSAAGVRARWTGGADLRLARAVG